MKLPPCDRCGGRILFEEEFYCFNCGARPTGYEAPYARITQQEPAQADMSSWESRALRSMSHARGFHVPSGSGGQRIYWVMWKW